LSDIISTNLDATARRAALAKLVDDQVHRRHTASFSRRRWSSKR
jgi:hypothetical protein